MPRVHRYFKELRLRQFRAIVELARRGSFAEVARALDLSVASVWQQIRGMEKEFGVTLVQVIGRQVKLTDEGRLVVDRAAPVVEGFDGLRELFREPAEGVPRRIVLAMPPSLVLHELRQPLASYRRDWPAVEINVREGTSAESLERLLAGEADVAIAGHMQGSGRMSPAVSAVPLLEYPFVVLAPPGHPLLAAARLRLADLVKYPLVLTREGSFSRERVVGVLETAGLWSEATASLTAGSVDVLAEYVRLGLGVTVASVSPQLLGRPPRGQAALEGLHYRDASRLFGFEQIGFFCRTAYFERPHVRGFREVVVGAFAAPRQRGRRS